jgi:hypothetical protein
MKKAITLFISLILWIDLSAQKPQTVNRAPLLFKSSGREDIRQIIQNKEGDYILVGSDKNWFSDDDNALFTRVSAHAGKIKLEQKVVPIGRRGAQKANCVVQTRDGGYVLAGFTDSTNNQKKKQPVPNYIFLLWGSITKTQ